MNQYTVEKITTGMGVIGLIRTAAEGCGPDIIHIFLPSEGFEITEKIDALYPRAVDLGDQAPGQIGSQIRRFFKGEGVEFSLDELDFGICGVFQRRILRLQFQIPRGRVCTYGGLAAKLGCPGAARAVGTALARNPFPIVIPCHRTIRSDGTLGGFGGGLKMKKALLEMEGVRFDRFGSVPDEFFW